LNGSFYSYPTGTLSLVSTSTSITATVSGSDILVNKYYYYNTDGGSTRIYNSNNIFSSLTSNTRYYIYVNLTGPSGLTTTLSGSTYTLYDPPTFNNPTDISYSSFSINMSTTNYSGIITYSIDNGGTINSTTGAASGLSPNKRYVVTASYTIAGSSNGTVISSPIYTTYRVPTFNNPTDISYRSFSINMNTTNYLGIITYSIDNGGTINLSTGAASGLSPNKEYVVTASYTIAGSSNGTVISSPIYTTYREPTLSLNAATLTSTSFDIIKDTSDYLGDTTYSINSGTINSSGSASGLTPNTQYTVTLTYAISGSSNGTVTIDKSTNGNFPTLSIDNDKVYEIYSDYITLKLTNYYNQEIYWGGDIVADVNIRRKYLSTDSNNEGIYNVKVKDKNNNYYEKQIHYKREYSGTLDGPSIEKSLKYKSIMFILIGEGGKGAPYNNYDGGAAAYGGGGGGSGAGIFGIVDNLDISMVTISNTGASTLQMNYSSDGGEYILINAFDGFEGSYNNGGASSSFDSSEHVSFVNTSQTIEKTKIKELPDVSYTNINVTTVNVYSTGGNGSNRNGFSTERKGGNGAKGKGSGGNGATREGHTGGGGGGGAGGFFVSDYQNYYAYQGNGGNGNLGGYNGHGYGGGGGGEGGFGSERGGVSGGSTPYLRSNPGYCYLMSYKIE
jgi:hypothetical protein